MEVILTYYGQEAGLGVADRFFDAFLRTVEKALRTPKTYPPISGTYRRANIPRFPYHILYRETDQGIRVLVLRHHRRHPKDGLGRS